MELTANEKLVHQMYIAYYQRPADPEGLQYWVDQIEQNGSWEAVSGAFGAPENAEYQALYGDKTRAELVAELYESAFNRAAVQEEIDFWANSEHTDLNLAFAIINGAQNDDLATVNAKVEFSAELGSSLETNDAYATLEDPKALLADVTKDTDVTEQYVTDAIASGTAGETFTLTAAGDDRFFGTEKNDTFTAEAGTLQAGDQLLDQSTTDNDTLNAVITNANKAAGPATLLNIENVNLDLDVFSGAAFDAANTEGATITASSSKLGFNGEFTLNTAGDNNVVAGENVTNLIVNDLEAGTVNTGAAESASVTTVAGTDGEVANVTVNGDIALTVAVATDLNLTATADSVVDLTPGAVDTITGSGEGVITVQGDLSGVTDITGVDTAVTTTGANASKWEVNTISIAEDLGATGAITVADAANVTIDAEQTALTITGQSNTGSSVNVSSNLAALGSVAFANGTLAAAELELTAAGVEVASLNANNVALTVNVAEGAEFADLDGTNNIELVGAGDVVVANADDLSSLDASNLNGALEVTTANAAEINGAVGNNTVELTASNNVDFVGQAGDDSVTFGGTAAFAAEANLVLGAGDDTVTLVNNVTGTMAINFGEGNDTLVLEASVSTANATSFTLVGLENVVLGGDATMAADQLDGQEYSIRGEGFAASTLTVNLEDGGDSVDLSGLNVSDSVSAGAAITIVGGDGDDTITGTDGADTFVTTSVDTGGIDTITNFAANDFVKFFASTDYLDATGTDFDTGNTTLADALADVSAAAQAEDGTDSTGWAVAFTYGEETYVYIDGATDGYAAADDAVVQITGTDVSTLTADNFI